jgi:hypothetical protein
LLPPLGSTNQDETFLVVASADAKGAEVLAGRIREQFERSEQLAGGADYRISATPLQLPTAAADKPLEKLVQEVADSITASVMETLRHKQAADTEFQAHATA